MTKQLKLENGKQEWLLYGGYHTKESFDPLSLDVSTVVRFELYENGETMPKYKFDMIRTATDANINSFTDGKATIVAKLTGDLTWTFKLYIDDVETLPKLNYTTGLLSDLIDQVCDYETGYAVCTEGKMAGKIVRIQHHGLGWFINWEHNNERAAGFLDKQFVIIKDPTVVILEQSKVKQIRNIGSLNYELGVMLAELIRADCEDERIAQLTTVTSSIGHENLIVEAIYDGFNAEFINKEYGYSEEETKKHFEECLEMIEVSFKEKQADTTTGDSDEFTEIKEYIEREFNRIQKNYMGRDDAQRRLKAMVGYSVGHMILSLDYEKYPIAILDDLLKPFNTTFFEMKQAIELDVNRQF